MATVFDYVFKLHVDSGQAIENLQQFSKMVDMVLSYPETPESGDILPTTKLLDLAAALEQVSAETMPLGDHWKTITSNVVTFMTATADIVDRMREMSAGVREVLASLGYAMRETFLTIPVGAATEADRKIVSGSIIPDMFHRIEGVMKSFQTEAAQLTSPETFGHQMAKSVGAAEAMHRALLTVSKEFSSIGMPSELVDRANLMIGSLEKVIALGHKAKKEALSEEDFKTLRATPDLGAYENLVNDLKGAYDQLQSQGLQGLSASGPMFGRLAEIANQFKQFPGSIEEGVARLQRINLKNLDTGRFDPEMAKQWNSAVTGFQRGLETLRKTMEVSGASDEAIAMVQHWIDAIKKANSIANKGREVWEAPLRKRLEDPRLTPEERITIEADLAFRAPSVAEVAANLEAMFMHGVPGLKIGEITIDEKSRQWATAFKVDLTHVRQITADLIADQKKLATIAGQPVGAPSTFTYEPVQENWAQSVKEDVDDINKRMMHLAELLKMVRELGVDLPKFELATLPGEQGEQMQEIINQIDLAIQKEQSLGKAASGKNLERARKELLAFINLTERGAKEAIRALTEEEKKELHINQLRRKWQGVAFDSEKAAWTDREKAMSKLEDEGEYLKVLIARIKELTAARLADGQVKSPEQLNDDRERALALIQQQLNQGLDIAGYFERAASKVTHMYYGIRRVGQSLQSVGRDLTNFGRRITGFFDRASQAYYELASSTTFAAMAMETPVQLQDALEEKLQQTAIAMKAQNVTANSLAEATRLWAAATGEVIDSESELDGIIARVEQIQRLAVLNRTQLEETTKLTGAVLSEFRMQTDAIVPVTETLNYAAARSRAELSDLADAFINVGPTANDLGVSLEQVAASTVLLADAGLTGSRAGRAMRQVFIQMLKPTADHNEAMNEALGLTEDLGVTWQNLVFPGGEYIGLAEYVDLLAGATENMTTHQRQELLATIATANELPALTTLITRQIEARKLGINVLRVYEKVMQGTIDEEVRAYATLHESITGIPFELQSAHQVMEDQLSRHAESVAAEAEEIKRRWEEAMQDMGQSAQQLGLVLMEVVTGPLATLAEFLEKHPEVVAGGALVGVGATGLGTLSSTLGSVLRITELTLIAKGLGPLAVEFATHLGTIGAVSESTAAAIAGLGTHLTSLGAIAGSVGTILGGLAAAAWAGFGFYALSEEVRSALDQLRGVGEYTDEALAPFEELRQNFEQPFEVDALNLYVRYWKTLPKYLGLGFGAVPATLFDVLRDTPEEQIAGGMTRFTANTDEARAAMRALGYEEGEALTNLEDILEVVEYMRGIKGVTPRMLDTSALKDWENHWEKTVGQITNVNVEAAAVIRKSYRDSLPMFAGAADFVLPASVTLDTTTLEQDEARLKEIIDNILGVMPTSVEGLDLTGTQKQIWNEYIQQVGVFWGQLQTAQATGEGALEDGRKRHNDAMESINQELLDLEERFADDVKRIRMEAELAADDEIEAARKTHGENVKAIEVAYAKAIAAAQQNYRDSLADIAKSETKSLIEAVESYNKSERRRIEDEARDDAKRTKKNNDDKLKQYQSYADKLLDIEKNHQRALEDLQRSHNNSLLDLIEARDVKAIRSQIRSYQEQRQQQEIERQRQIDDASKDHQERLAEIAENQEEELAELEETREIERKRREEDQAERLADIRADAAERRAAAAEELDKAKAAAEAELEEALHLEGIRHGDELRRIRDQVDEKIKARQRQFDIDKALLEENIAEEQAIEKAAHEQNMTRIRVQNAQRLAEAIRHNMDVVKVWRDAQAIMGELPEPLAKQVERYLTASEIAANNLEVEASRLDKAASAAAEAAIAGEPFDYDRWKQQRAAEQRADQTDYYSQGYLGLGLGPEESTIPPVPSSPVVGRGTAVPTLSNGPWASEPMSEWEADMRAALENPQLFESYFQKHGSMPRMIVPGQASVDPDVLDFFYPTQTSPAEAVHRVELVTNVDVTIDGELTENERKALTEQIVEAVSLSQEEQYKLAEMNLWIR